MQKEILRGVVRWFNNLKLYGIITGADRQEYHVGMDQIGPHGTGFKSLDAGEEVTFEPVQQSFRQKRPEAKRVLRTAQVRQLPRNLDASAEPTAVVNLKVLANGRIYMPRRSEDDPRDYASGKVRAFYVGHPGVIVDKTTIAVELPEDEKIGTILVPVDFNGGIMGHGEWSCDFPRGAFVLVIRISGNTCLVAAKKIGVRRQDSTSVIDDRDYGEWVVVEVPFEQALIIPVEYANERELAKKLEAQILEKYPDFSGHRHASFAKFGPAIASAIIASREPTTSRYLRSSVDY